MKSRKERKEEKEFKKLLDKSSLDTPEAKKMRKLGKKVIKDIERRKKWGQ